MNQTLQKLRQITQGDAANGEDSAIRKCQAACAELAAPLIQAFHDLENEFVKIDMLKKLWPDDYDQRNDRVSGLLIAWIGSQAKPHGLRLAVPYGSLTFEVALRQDGSPVFLCVRDIHSQRPAIMEFNSRDEWLEFFFKSIAEFIEL
ncbi:hypothetical protein GWK36_02495 [Caldichromatium japonicum]|uniref:Uncharacterized protein n=1 Tax=Caldichromatium japonicum TaxID=2699430 RepID=A0A6G7VB13_9GAMM|nr:hypothetical protein [Caldichromatium japonicum]QIK37056.1 hypothetical protein GWK36_02495 [Caldichromatium japonicum]